MSGNESTDFRRYGGVVGNEDKFTLTVGGEEVGIEFPRIGGEEIEFPKPGGESDDTTAPEIDHDEIARRVAELIDIPEIPDDYARQDDLDSLYGELEDLADEVDNIDQISADELESLADEYRDLLSDYRDVLDDIEQLTGDTPTRPEPETPETGYLSGLIMSIAEEYERSSDRLETLREEHRSNMSDENISDILYD